MFETVGSIEEIGNVFITALGKYKVRTAERIYESLMETTPEATGALKGNWYINKGLKVGKEVFKPEAKEKPTPDLERYVRATGFTIYNPTPYIIIVNNGEGGNDNNQNFIDKAIEMARNDA